MKSSFLQPSYEVGFDFFLEAEENLGVQTEKTLART